MLSFEQPHVCWYCFVLVIFCTIMFTKNSSKWSIRKEYLVDLLQKKFQLNLRRYTTYISMTKLFEHSETTQNLYFCQKDWTFKTLFWFNLQWPSFCFKRISSCPTKNYFTTSKFEQNVKTSKIQKCSTTSISKPFLTHRQVNSSWIKKLFDSIKPWI